MTKLGLFGLMMTTACGAVAQPQGMPQGMGDGGAGGGDDDTTITCQVAADCAADQHCDNGLCIDNAVDPEAPKVTLAPSTIADERGDAITFSDAGPRHAHAGPPIALDQGCPAVFKYGYLLGEQAPQFGSEDAPNPLAWQFEVDGAFASADYRVRTETATVLDWTPAGADLAVTLHRDGSHAIPQLQSVGGKYFLDLRARDAGGREGIATACWEHHPLAAPIEVRGLDPAGEAGSILNLLFGINDSPISSVAGPSAGVPVYTSRIRHSTAEPVTIQLAIPVPTANFAKLAVTDLIPVQTTQNISCGITCVPGSTSSCVPEDFGDARCKTTTPVDPTDSLSTGAVTHADWTIAVIDARTNSPSSECTVAGLTVTCNLPGRLPQASVKELIVRLAVSGMIELKPSTGTIAELSFQNVSYVGAPMSVAGTRCDSFTFSTANEFGERFKTCAKFTTFHRLVALDQLRVDFRAPRIDARTASPALAGAPAGELVAPPYLATGGVVGLDFAWNAGNDNLPGTEH
jgi:hypothetical protein